MPPARLKTPAWYLIAVAVFIRRMRTRGVLKRRDVHSISRSIALAIQHKEISISDRLHGIENRRFENRKKGRGISKAPLGCARSLRVCTSRFLAPGRKVQSRTQWSSPAQRYFGRAINLFNNYHIQSAS